VARFDSVQQFHCDCVLPAVSKAAVDKVGQWLGVSGCGRTAKTAKDMVHARQVSHLFCGTPLVFLQKVMHA